MSDAACFRKMNIKREEEEIRELCLEMRESKERKSKQFESLSYEDGVMAAIRWLFFANALRPSDLSNDDLRERLDKAKIQIFREEQEQVRENVE